MDLSNYTDEELDALIEGKGEEPTHTVPENWRPLSRPHASAAAPRPDTTMGMSTPQLIAAGAGGELNAILQGIKEKGQLVFAPEGKAGEDLIARINADRAERARIDEMLYSNPAAVAGQLGARVIPAIAAPARLPAQVALEGALDFAKPGGKKVSGIGSELAGSALHGAVGAGTAYGVGKALNALGRAAGAKSGRMTPHGEEAMKTSGAAERLGLPPTTIGQLAPQGAVGQVERNLPGYGARVMEQARALERATGGEKVPGIFDKGEAYARELTDAARNRLAMGADKYKEVDTYVAEKGLAGYQPKYTANMITNTGNPGYPRAQELLEKYGWDISPVAGTRPKQLSTTELPLSTYHEMRVATNRSLAKVNRMLDGPMPTAEDRLAKKYLSDLKTALDNDAERWAKQNAGNAEAMELYKDATQYYRDVVAPTVLDNPLASKLLSKTRGFATGEEALRSSLSTTGRPRVDLLRPTMSQRGEDITQVLRNLPDVTEAAISGNLPASASFDPLRLAYAASGHPIGAAEALLSRVPGLSELSASPLAKRLYFAENVLEGASPARSTVGQTPLQALLSRELPRQGALPRAAWGAAQYPQEKIESKTKRGVGTK